MHCCSCLAASGRHRGGAARPSLNHLQGDRRTQILLGSSINILLSASPACSHTPSPASAQQLLISWEIGGVSCTQTTLAVCRLTRKEAAKPSQATEGLGLEHHKCAAWMFYHLLKEWPWSGASAHKVMVLHTNLLSFPFLVVGCSSLLITFPCRL